MHLTKEKRTEVITKHGNSETNTGLPEVQVALYTERIQHLTEHLKDHKKDVSTERALVMMVGKRKKLLNYLKNKDINKYRDLIKVLNIRK